MSENEIVQEPHNEQEEQVNIVEEVTSENIAEPKESEPEVTETEKLQHQ